MISAWIMAVVHQDFVELLVTKIQVVQLMRSVLLCTCSISKVKTLTPLCMGMLMMHMHIAYR